MFRCMCKIDHSLHSNLQLSHNQSVKSRNASVANWLFRWITLHVETSFLRYLLNETETFEKILQNRPQVRVTDMETKSTSNRRVQLN